MRVLHLTDDRGEALATLVQHACHPETLWKQNRRITSDYCGVLCRHVERKVGGVTLYVNGALGAMVTAAMPWAAAQGDREDFLESLGEAMGEHAVRLVRRSRRQTAEAQGIQTARSTVVFPAGDNSLYGLIHALGVVESRDLGAGLASEVSLVRIGPASIVALPGEAAPALGREVLGRVNGSPRFLFGLANDELGYLLPPEFFYDRRYAYECTMSPGRQAATRIALALDKASAAIMR
jgi:hypothetical protein